MYLSTLTVIVVCLSSLIQTNAHAETKCANLSYLTPDRTAAYTPMSEEVVLRCITPFGAPLCLRDEADRLIKVPKDFDFGKKGIENVLDNPNNAIFTFENGPWQQNGVRWVKIYEGHQRKNLIVEAIQVRADINGCKSLVNFFQLLDGRGVWLMNIVGDKFPLYATKLPSDFNPTEKKAAEIMRDQKYIKEGYVYKRVSFIERLGQKQVPAPPDTYVRYSYLVRDGKTVQEYAHDDGYIFFSQAQRVFGPFAEPERTVRRLEEGEKTLDQLLAERFEIGGGSGIVGGPIFLKKKNEKYICNPSFPGYATICGRSVITDLPAQ